MILRDWGSLMILIFIAICAASGAISSYLWQDDNAYEEAMEYIIEQQKGWRLDLSPLSPDLPL